MQPTGGPAQRSPREDAPWLTSPSRYDVTSPTSKMPIVSHKGAGESCTGHDMLRPNALDRRASLTRGTSKRVGNSEHRAFCSHGGSLFQTACRLGTDSAACAHVVGKREVQCIVGELLLSHQQQAQRHDDHARQQPIQGVVPLPISAGGGQQFI